MPGLRVPIIITGGLFAATIILAALGHALQTSGIVAAGPAVELAAKIVFSSLALALFLSAVPLMVTTVLRVQVGLGNADRPVIRTLIAHRRLIVTIYWVLALLGLAVAIPAVIQAGAFASS